MLRAGVTIATVLLFVGLGDWPWWKILILIAVAVVALVLGDGDHALRDRCDELEEELAACRCELAEAPP